MARGGVLGISPYGPDILSIGMDTAKGLGDIVGRQRQNEAARLANEKTQALMPSEIGAGMAKNTADQEYYPKFQGANLAEIGARTGLYNAQADQANTKGDPLAMFNTLYSAWQKAPDNSPEKDYLESSLNQMIGGGTLSTLGGHSGAGRATTGRGGSVGGIGGGEQLVPGQDVNPYSKSSRSLRGAQYLQPNADGSETVFTSPTTPTETRLQTRLSAKSEAESIQPFVRQGLEPYWGRFGNYAFLRDQLASEKGDKAATERLVEAEAARQMLRESAAIALQKAGVTNIGEEAISQQVKQMYHGIPANFLRHLNTPLVNVEGSKRMSDQLTKAIDKYSGVVAQNFPYEVDESPAWAQKPPSWGFRGGKYIPRADAQQAPQQQPRGAPQQGDSPQPGALQSIPLDVLQQIAGGG